MEITQRELTSLNKRIESETSREPLTSFQTDLVDLLLTRHRAVVQQYNDESELCMSLKRKVSETIEREARRGNVRVDFEANVITWNDQAKAKAKAKQGKSARKGASAHPVTAT